MAHSNRLRNHWLFVFVEILLFISAIATAYYSQVGQWSIFASISALSAVLYAILKIVEAVPSARRLVLREDIAAQIADNALTYGVRDYFNMQSADEQARRNSSTQRAIEEGRTFWLCANSGASYLDPAIYRHWPFIKRRLDDGAELRVVLLDPFSGEKAFRNQLNVNGEAFDAKLNLANLIRLQNNYPNVEIRLAQHGMHATVFATEHCLFFDPYQIALIADHIENRSFSIRLLPSTPEDGVGLYRLFKSHFDTLWRTSATFPDWMRNHRDRLPDGLPALRVQR